MLEEVDPRSSLALRHLWQLYRHDLSEYRGMQPNGDGTFHTRHLDAYADNSDRASLIIQRDKLPVGFVLVVGLDRQVRSIGEFFIVRGLRRQGIGRQGALEVLHRFPGRWDVAFQEENPAAARFWRRVADQAAPGRWRQERRQDPTRSFIPPDVWISMTVEATVR
jgi:predicted acetyltransferase